MFPIKGTVGGPGGKFRGRRLARKYLAKTPTANTMGRYRRPNWLSILASDIVLALLDSEVLGGMRAEKKGLTSGS